MEKNDIIRHNLVPKHEILLPAEKDELLARIPMASMPKIHISDPGLKLFGIEASSGDIVKISREDATGKNTYYRLVIK
ncbi:MAG TPA: DNA-directed RNA polymerase subunit RpoH/Rpb5 C-terminal domain-containing protein [Candidatus Micrarchaeota archaeon]|nr:DNA-directed RNA polymerase subunit RpoH/Rpb5 C-terminal domain-containing protein [Candidatus Micrarchaeota archaeon]